MNWFSDIVNKTTDEWRLAHGLPKLNAAETRQPRGSDGLPTPVEVSAAPLNATPPTSSPAPVSPKLSEAASVGVAPDYYDQERADNREEYARLDELARSGCSNE